MRFLILFAALAAPAWTQVVISQVYGGGGNAGASLTNDFVELFNRGREAVDVNGWTVQYASATGATWQVTPIAGRLEPGRYFLVQQAAGAGGTAALPAPDASGAIAMSATAAKVALVRRATALEGNAPSADADVVDSIGYGAADWARGTPVRGLSNTTAALRGRNGCVDTGDNAADFQVATPAPRNSAAAATDCLAEAAPPESARISQIQGSGNRSPLAGRVVTLRGVVTGRRNNGFYVQSLPEDEDADPNTSEGVFVFLNAAPEAGIVNGRVVSVLATVAEFRPASDPLSPTLTELTSPSITLTQQSRALPPLVEITTAQLYPAGGPDVLERFEGMRVRFASLRAVSGTGGSFDEVNATPRDNGIFWAVLDGTPTPAREPGVNWDGNPERLRVDTQGSESVFAGDRWDDVTGNLDYGFRAYTVVLDAVGSIRRAVVQRAPRVSPSAPGELRVASMNLRRLFDNVDDPGTADVVPTDRAVAVRLAAISDMARTQLDLPDVIAVQEAENLNVLKQLAQSLGDRYEAFLEEGNDPGGIDLGFLVNTRKVTVLGVAQEEKGASYRTPAGASAVLHDRPPLVLRASMGGVRFTILAVHLRSLINVETPEVQAKRRAQAEAVAAMAQRLQRDNPGEGLAVIGDFNAFPFDDGYVDVAGIIARGAGLVDVGASLPIDQGYTYIQDGNVQILDLVMVNEALAARRSNFEVWHGNTTAPLATNPYSDHDVPVAAFRLDGAASVRVLDSAAWTFGDLAPAQIVSAFGPGVEARSNVEVNGSGAPYWGGGPGQVNFEIPRATIPGEAAIRVAGQELRRRIVTAAPSLFAARSLGGGLVELVVNGLGIDPVVHLWIDGREAEFAGAFGRSLVARAAADVRRGVPVEVLIEVGGRVSQRGVMVTIE